MIRNSLTLLLVGAGLFAITSVFAEADSKTTTVTNVKGVVDVVVVDAEVDVVTLTAEEEAGQYCAADYEDTKRDMICCQHLWEPDFCYSTYDENCDPEEYEEIQCPCKSEPTRSDTGSR